MYSDVSSDGYEPSPPCMQGSLFAGWDLMALCKVIRLSYAHPLLPLVVSFYNWAVIVDNGVFDPCLLELMGK